MASVGSNRVQPNGHGGDDGKHQEAAGDHDQRQSQNDESPLERAAHFLLVVGDDHGSDEGPREVGARPEERRHRNEHADAQARRGRPGDGSDLGLEGPRRCFGEYLEEGLDLTFGFTRRGEDPVDGDGEDQCRKERQHGVERNAGGQEGHIVVTHLAPQRSSHVTPFTPTECPPTGRHRSDDRSPGSALTSRAPVTTPTSDDIASNRAIRRGGTSPLPDHTPGAAPGTRRLVHREADRPCRRARCRPLRVPPGGSP